MLIGLIIFIMILVGLGILHKNNEYFQQRVTSAKIAIQEANRQCRTNNYIATCGAKIAKPTPNARRAVVVAEAKAKAAEARVKAFKTKVKSAEMVAKRTALNAAAFRSAAKRAAAFAKAQNKTSIFFVL